MFSFLIADSLLSFLENKTIAFTVRGQMIEHSNYCDARSFLDCKIGKLERPPTKFNRYGAEQTAQLSLFLPKYFEIAQTCFYTVNN